MNIEYDISGNDNFEYAQDLCGHSEEYYGLDTDYTDYYYAEEDDMDS